MASPFQRDRAVWGRRLSLITNNEWARWFSVRSALESIRLGILVVVFCAAGTTVGCDPLGRLHSAPSSVPTVCPSSTLDAHAYLPQALRLSDLSEYTLMIDIPGADPRRHPCGLIAERSQAYVRNDAVTGPGRAEVDAYSRKIGYPITDQPLIPIQGPFVSDHQGVFDVQGQTTAFLTSNDAQNYADHLASAARGTKWMPISLAGEHDVTASGAVLGQAPNQDWYATAILRIGATVVHIDADGTRSDVEQVLGRLVPIVRSNLSAGLLHGSPPPAYSYHQ